MINLAKPVQREQLSSQCVTIYFAFGSGKSCFFFIQKFKHLANVLSFTVTVSSIIRPPFFSLEKAFEVVSFLKLILKGKVKLD